MNLAAAFGLYHGLRGIWEHARNARLSRPELLALQQRKFRKLAIYAFQNSRYYSSLMRQLRLDPAHCRPEDFPVLTKPEVIERFDDIATDARITRRAIAEFLAHSKQPEELFANEFHVLHTSGTSGTAACFVYSRREWIRACSQVVRMSRVRLRKRVAFVGATRGHFAGVSLTTAGNEGANRLFYRVRTFDVNIPLPQLMGELTEFQPHCVSGYGGVIRMLAEAQLRGELRIRPAEVLNGGEPLRPDDQAIIEQAFGVRVRNVYASTECLYMGATLGDDNSLYLFEDEVAFELASDHICVTNLFNSTLPLIRYRIDDVLVPDEASHALPFRRMQGLVGRREENLVFVNRHGREDFIHAIIIVELIIAGLASWQVAQPDHHSFVFRARLCDGLSNAQRKITLENIRRRLNELLAEKDMENVCFTVDEVADLPADPTTGKFRLVVPPRAYAALPAAPPLRKAA